MKLENPSVTGVEAGGAPAVIRTKLSNATLVEVPSHVSRFGYDRSRLRSGIVHIGVGNFFRAHEALYVDRCLHLPGQEAWAIVGVGLGDGPGKKEKAEAIRSQEGLYTLTEYSPDGTVSTRVIGSLIEYLHAPAEIEAVFDRLASPDTRIVSLTITEGGYNIDETTKELLSYPALMCGYRLVDEALRQPAIAAYLDAFMDKDVLPLLKGPDGVSLEEYKRQILKRFTNPAIGDQLLRIAQNGIAKLPVFLSKTLSELLDRGGAFERVALCLACFEHYLHGHDLLGNTFPVDEPLMTTEDQALLQSQDPLAVLRLSPFKALQLFADDVFIKAFLAARKHLASRGPVGALRFAAEA